MAESTRRTFLAGGALAGGTMLAAPLVAGMGRTQLLAPATPARQTLTPDQALQRLVDGNRAYLAETPSTALVNRTRRVAITGSQAPIAAYVSCSDSRVPPELLFGRGLGDLFIIRNAGNTVDTVALGSIEYAVAILNVPLVVVMGHQSCGAVKAAVDVVQKNAVFPGVIGRMIEPIIPAALSVRDREGDFLDNAVRANVSRVVRLLRTATDPIMLDPQRDGRLKVIGAYYGLDTGAVDFFDLPQVAAPV